MAAGEVAGAHQALLRLADAVVEAVSEGTVRGSGTTRSVLFSLERVRRTPTNWRRRRLAEDPEGLRTGRRRGGRVPGAWRRCWRGRRRGVEGGQTYWRQRRSRRALT